MNNVKVGIVSGYFNPLHRGHIEYINAAKKQCDYLVCIVNNDIQVKLKGSEKFMDEDHRTEIVKNLKSVDAAIVSMDTDSSVAKTLAHIADSVAIANCEFIFFNSGDRKNNENMSEVCACEEKHINRVFIELPKICSSSELKRNLSSDNIK